MNVLVVEDNPAEAELTVQAFEETDGKHHLSVVGDGEAALNFMRKVDVYQDSPTSDLVLLDLNLPKLNGRDVLSEMRVDPALKKIPVIVISNSNAPDDIEAVYELNGNCYLVKPVDLNEFFALIQKLVQFWGNARLPSLS